MVVLTVHDINEGRLGSVTAITPKYLSRADLTAMQETIPVSTYKATGATVTPVESLILLTMMTITIQGAPAAQGGIRLVMGTLREDEEDGIAYYPTAPSDDENGWYDEEDFYSSSSGGDDGLDFENSDTRAYGSESEGHGV